MLSTIEKMIGLKSVDIFAHANIEQLARVAALTEEIGLDDGATLYAEGHASDALYFLLNGRIVLEKVGTPAFMVNAGETFGTLAALDRQPHLFSAKAAGAAQVLKLGARDFDDLLTLDSGLALAVLRVLCRLIRSGLFAAR